MIPKNQKKTETEREKNPPIQVSLKIGHSWTQKNPIGSGSEKIDKSFNSHKIELKQKTFSAKYNMKKRYYGPLKLYYKPNIHSEGKVDFLLREFNVKETIESVAFTIKLEYKTGNPVFVKMLTSLKIGFFVLSVASFFLFRRKLMLQSTDSLVIEQTMISRLGLLLIGFNDPLQALLLYEPTLLK